MHFVIYSISRNLMVVSSKQDAKFIGGSLELCLEWTLMCPKTFSVLFCSVLYVLFCVVTIIPQYTIFGGVFQISFPEFKDHCFNLYIENWNYTTL